MKNKKGFTLVELLAVIAIIALISLVAIPNIIGLSAGVKKDQMLDDAKKMISMAKYLVNKDYQIKNLTKPSVCVSNVCTLQLSLLNNYGDISQDPDGGEYDQANSYVKYTKTGGTATYCVVLKGSQRHIGTATDCKGENALHSRSNVVDNVQ